MCNGIDILDAQKLVTGSTESLANYNRQLTRYSNLYASLVTQFHLND